MSGGAEIWIETGFGGALAVRRLDGVVTDLAVFPEDDAPTPGDRWIGRLRRIDRSSGAGFVDLGGAVDGYLPKAQAHEGALLSVAVAQAARLDDGKGPVLADPRPAPAGATVGRAEQVAPGVRAQALWPGAECVLIDGPADGCWTDRRAALDDAGVAAAFDAAAAPAHALPGGGWLRLHPTPAMLVADVDAGGGARVSANTAAVAALLRFLRLRAEGGLVMLDLIDPPRRGAARGRAGEDAAALCASAEALAAADPIGLRVGRISPHWTLDLSRPRATPPLATAWFAQPIAPELRAGLRRARAAAAAAPGRRIALRCSAPIAHALAGPASADLAYAADQAGAPIVVTRDDGAATPTAQPA